MRIDDLPTSDRIEDRRGGGFPGGRGGIGIGTIVVLGLIGWALGIDPRVLIQGAEDRQHGSRVDGRFRQSREDLHAADLGDVFGSDPIRLRGCPGRDGPILLPARPEGLPGHQFL